MRRGRLTIGGESEIAEINISPLIDMIFILLIFFIVTTVFVEETGVEITRPQATTATSLERESIQVVITDRGNIIYGGQEIGVNGVRATVRRLSQREPIPVILLVDESASAGLVVRVMDEAKIGGAASISISAQQP